MRLPEALPDELLFSRLIRYCCLYAVPIPQLLNDVYGDPRASINPILTAGLNSFSNLFNENTDNLLTEQTLAPLFMHYYPHYKAKFITALASSDNYTAIRLSQLSSVKERNKFTLKMCLKCIQEDIENFGVAYWHRTHQIPGIESCCEHQLQLIHINLPNRLKLSIGLPSCLKPIYQTSSYESFNLARFAKQILLKQSKHVSIFKIVNYKSMLANLGYVTKVGQIRRVKLLSDFYQFTSRLQYPSSNFLPSSDSDFKYITNLLYGNYSQHIVKYLILGYWLSQQHSAKKASVADNKHPTKRSKSLNRECLSLLKQGLSISAISKKIGKSRTYVKAVAYAANMTDLFTPIKLKSSIRNSVISLAWKGFHRCEIARRVSVSTGSVEMLISSVSGLVKWRKQCKHDSKRRRYKCQILRYRQHNPSKIRRDIKRDLNAAFYWLYTHEHQWLDRKSVV